MFVDENVCCLEGYGCIIHFIGGEFPCSEDRGPMVQGRRVRGGVK